jgi:hypothetical protein
MIFKLSKITIEQLRDFYRYNKVSGWSGSVTAKDEHLGSSISLEDENDATIVLYGGNKWAYVSIENEKVKYQYTENRDLRFWDNCPITTNEKEISFISKFILNWYNELGLPKSIDTFKFKESSVTVVKEVEINVFNDIAVLRLLSDGTTYLLFNSFPPEKSKLTKYQINNFEKILSEAINKKVIHEDRELFIIYDVSQKMIDDVILFLNGLK